MRGWGWKLMIVTFLNGGLLTCYGDEMQIVNLNIILREIRGTVDDCTKFSKIFYTQLPFFVKFD